MFLLLRMTSHFCLFIKYRSDVFSYGVVLWELVTQKVPWDTLNTMQVRFYGAYWLGVKSDVVSATKFRSIASYTRCIKLSVLSVLITS
jgi:hypothetical protein